MIHEPTTIQDKGDILSHPKCIHGLALSDICGECWLAETNRKTFQDLGCIECGSEPVRAGRCGKHGE